jgi:hypothetical protein
MGDQKRRFGLVDQGVQPLVRDQLGRGVDPGASVMLPVMDTKTMIWQIEGVRPNLHPQAPPNTVILGVVMRAQLVVPKGAAVRELILVASPQIPDPVIEAEIPLPTDAELPVDDDTPREPVTIRSEDDLSAGFTGSAGAPPERADG